MHCGPRPSNHQCSDPSIWISSPKQFYEKKMDRKYVTRAGLKAVEEYVRKNSKEALQAFGSKAAKSTFMVNKLKEIPVDAIFVPEDGVIHVAEPAAGTNKVST